MTALPWLLGAAGVGLGVLILRKRAQAQSGGDDACAAICTAAEKATGVPASACMASPVGAYAACKAASGVGDFVKGLFTAGNIDWNAYDATNKQLNGEVELALPDELAANTFDLLVPGARCMWGTVLRFKSGAVPFKGAPGWEKCAPGTKDMWGMFGSAGALYREPAAGKRIKIVPSLMFAGRAGDPTTAGPFGGTGYYWKGRPFTCKTAPAWNVRDQRGDSDNPPPCGDAFGSATPSTTVTQGATSSTTFSCPPPPGFTWRGDHWERMRPGEQQDLGPCAVHLSSAGLLAKLGAGKANQA